ncbi:hypothetical protein ACFXKX_18100 [Streptomyces scopuliridis]|uniref:hypothetical protein n=1 Tax=Streptomyces scopuliridis TaxID=452529 RepID=UPI0036AF44CA
MKLTVFQFEGTAEELDASQTLRELTQPDHGMTTVVQRPGPTSSASPSSTSRVPGVAEEGQEAVRALLRRSPAPELFVRFMAEATQWENVGVHGIKLKGAGLGDPLDYSRYLRLRKQGSQLGGFAYVYAQYSTINLRLSYGQKQLDELGIARARILTTGHREYRISVDLTDELSLREALRLAELAYNAT